MLKGAQFGSGMEASTHVQEGAHQQEGSTSAESSTPAEGNVAAGTRQGMKAKLRPRVIRRVGQNHMPIHGVHTVSLAGKPPNIRSYTVRIYTVLANPSHMPSAQSSSQDGITAN